MSLLAVEATFKSRCELCEEDCQPGDLIVLLPDDETWVHAGCAEDDGHEVEG